MVVIARKHLKESRSNKACAHISYRISSNHTWVSLVGRLGELGIVCGLVYDSTMLPNHFFNSSMIYIRNFPSVDSFDRIRESSYMMFPNTFSSQYVKGPSNPLYVNLADTYNRRFISMMVTQVLVDTKT